MRRYATFIMNERLKIDIAAKLSDLVSKARALGSLAPGKGYDPLGHQMCDLVSYISNYDDQITVLEFLKNKYPDLVDASQKISFESEKLLELSVVNAILNTKNENHGLDFEGLMKKGGYPYSWSMQRARQEAELYPKDSYTHLYLGTSSCLPQTAINLSLLTGNKTIFFDADEELVGIGNRFLTHLEELNILNEGQVTCCVYSSENLGKELEAHAKAVTFLTNFEDLDGALGVLSNYKNIDIFFVRSAGMAEIMYPIANQKTIDSCLDLKKRMAPSFIQQISNDKTEISTYPDFYLFLEKYRLR